MPRLVAVAGATGRFGGIVGELLGRGHAVPVDRSLQQAAMADVVALADAVDIEALHRRYPDIQWHDFGSWARSVRDRFRELCPHSRPPALQPL